MSIFHSCGNLNPRRADDLEELTSNPTADDPPYPDRIRFRLATLLLAERP